ncbi:MAG: hypothetical protein NTU53_16430 [Planctomycetota bacterium]|nr:hypothetical protein [Planctomycetota bacterium]
MRSRRLIAPMVACLLAVVAQAARLSTAVAGEARDGAKDIELKILKPASATTQPQPSASGKATAITDKTLVVWAAPAAIDFTTVEVRPPLGQRSESRWSSDSIRIEQTVGVQ